MFDPATRWRRHQPSALTLPAALGLLFLGLQHLFLIYIVIAYVPLGFEPPSSTNLVEIWWQTPERGRGIPSGFAWANTLFVVYLWASYRGVADRWWNRASPLLLVGLALLFLASQYALLRLLPVPYADYAIEIIELAR